MKQDTERYLAQVARDVNLCEGAAGIKRILVELHRRGTMSIHDMAEATRLPPPTISLILNRLSADGIVHRDKAGARFTEKGMKHVEAGMGIMSLGTVSCGSCDGTGYELDPGNRHSRLFDRIDKIVESRPDADVTVDQAKCTGETIARRLLLLHAWHVFDGNSILFLGDDDFISVAACSPEFLEDYFISDPSIASKPFDVTVIDIDPRILGKIDALGKQLLATNLTTIEQDVRRPLPPGLRNKFDIVFTDPPYTFNGCKLFLSRAIDALKHEKGSRVFLSFGHVSQDMMQQIQALIVQLGFVIDAIYPRFNRYEGGNIIGNMSQLLVLTLGENVHSPINVDEDYHAMLYTASITKDSNPD
ncbi:MAG: bis-aminopropyl spermidine synthase family protein [Candidatus Lokiarchaeota archaeon]|nr:bis-aminopropyl spermidine synthase family protein [Candidatus Lokiarchaeota archaeon]